MPDTRPLLPAELLAGGQHMLNVCNACRYCEGYCAVFPALQQRTSFVAADLDYLANLCHGCGSCHAACQYAPPHEFALNLPAMLAQVRVHSYHGHAWPTRTGAWLAAGSGLRAILLAVAFALLFLLTMGLADPSRLFAPHADEQGSFYALMPHGVMAGTFGLAGLFALIAILAGTRDFWRSTQTERYRAPDPVQIVQALRDALSLRYLKGGGDGCISQADAMPSHARRHAHHLTAGGFLLCFASTSLATFYHYGLDRPAPYPLTSLPVLLGIVGGVALSIGCIGLLLLRRADNPQTAVAEHDRMGKGFLWMLLFTSTSGLALMALRETAAMGVLLAAHLGIVMALFLTMPYGKFVHAFLRLAALTRFQTEQPAPRIRRPPSES